MLIDGIVVIGFRYSDVCSPYTSENLKPITAMASINIATSQAIDSQVQIDKLRCSSQLLNFSNGGNAIMMQFAVLLLESAAEAMLRLTRHAHHSHRHPATMHPGAA